MAASEHSKALAWSINISMSYARKAGEKTYGKPLRPTYILRLRLLLEMFKAISPDSPLFHNTIDIEIDELEQKWGLAK